MRITYKKVKEWIEEWNSNHKEMQFELSAYNGFYHLYKKGGSKMFSAKTPRLLWELFCIYRNGYFDGKENK